MHKRARQLLKLLVDTPEALSRNRHFSLFEMDEAAEIRRQAARIRQIRDDIRARDAHVVDVMRRADEVGVHLQFHSGAVQQAWLTAVEAEILKNSLEGDVSPSILARLVSQEAADSR